MHAHANKRCKHTYRLWKRVDIFLFVGTRTFKTHSSSLTTTLESNLYFCCGSLTRATKNNWRPNQTNYNEYMTRAANAPMKNNVRWWTTTITIKYKHCARVRQLSWRWKCLRVYWQQLARVKPTRAWKSMRAHEQRSACARACSTTLADMCATTLKTKTLQQTSWPTKQQTTATTDDNHKQQLQNIITQLHNYSYNINH